MRAADVLLGLGPEQAAISTRIAELRMEIRTLEGPISGPFTPLPDVPPKAVDVIERELSEAHRELDVLVGQRREASAPLPPGDCAPVKSAT
jgi:hypothetical protein